MSTTNDSIYDVVKNALSKSSPTMWTLVGEVSSCFLKLVGFPDLFDKVFLIIFKFS